VAIEHTTIDMNSNPDPTASFYCPMCLEHKPTTLSVALPCGHLFDRQCIQSWLASRVAEGSVTFNCLYDAADVLPQDDSTPPPSSAPTGGPCNAPIPPTVIEELLAADPPLLAKFKRFALLRANPLLRECPRCNAFNAGSEAAPRITCSSCGLVYCFAHSGAHPGRTCAEHVAATAGDTAATAAALSAAGIRPCPGCGVHVTRASGCDSVRCPLCSNTFCIQCGQIVRRLCASLASCLAPPPASPQTHPPLPRSPAPVRDGCGQERALRLLELGRLPGALTSPPAGAWLSGLCCCCCCCCCCLCCSALDAPYPPYPPPPSLQACRCVTILLCGLPAAAFALLAWLLCLPCCMRTHWRSRPAVAIGASLQTSFVIILLTLSGAIALPFALLCCPCLTWGLWLRRQAVLKAAAAAAATSAPGGTRASSSSSPPAPAAAAASAAQTERAAAAAADATSTPLSSPLAAQRPLLPQAPLPHPRRKGASTGASPLPPAPPGDAAQARAGCADGMDGSSAVAPALPPHPPSHHHHTTTANAVEHV
jgi:hypothetical protein